MLNAGGMVRRLLIDARALCRSRFTGPHVKEAPRNPPEGEHPDALVAIVQFEKERQRERRKSWQKAPYDGEAIHASWRLVRHFGMHVNEEGALC